MAKCFPMMHAAVVWVFAAGLLQAAGDREIPRRGDMMGIDLPAAAEDPALSEEGMARIRALRLRELGDRVPQPTEEDVRRGRETQLRALESGRAPWGMYIYWARKVETRIEQMRPDVERVIAERVRHKIQRKTPLELTFEWLQANASVLERLAVLKRDIQAATYPRAGDPGPQIDLAASERELQGLLARYQQLRRSDPTVDKKRSRTERVSN